MHRIVCAFVSAQEFPAIRPSKQPTSGVHKSRSVYDERCCEETYAVDISVVLIYPLHGSYLYNKVAIADSGRFSRVSQNHAARGHGCCQALNRTISQEAIEDLRSYDTSMARHICPIILRLASNRILANCAIINLQAELNIRLS